jgi:hypothetical protein
MWKIIMQLAKQATNKAWKSLDPVARQAAEEVTKSTPLARQIGYGPGSIGEAIYGAVGKERILAPKVEILNPSLLDKPIRASTWVPAKEADAMTKAVDYLPALRFKDKLLFVNTKFEASTSMDEHILNTLFKD